jgi:hypothetical protein
MTYPYNRKNFVGSRQTGEQEERIVSSGSPV